MRSKNLNFVFRLPVWEKKALEVMALREGRSKAAMIRELIREGAKSRGLENIGLYAALVARKDGSNDGSNDETKTS